MKQKSSRWAASETARSAAVSRYVNRSATFVFNIDERFSRSMTAYVQRPKSGDHDLTSARPVQLLTILAPSFMALIAPPASPIRQTCVR